MSIWIQGAWVTCLDVRLSLMTLSVGRIVLFIVHTPALFDTESLRFWIVKWLSKGRLWIEFELHTGHCSLTLLNGTWRTDSTSELKYFCHIDCHVLWSMPLQYIGTVISQWTERCLFHDKRSSQMKIALLGWISWEMSICSPESICSLQTRIPLEVYSPYRGLTGHVKM